MRYAGFALGYNISTAAFGGTTPLINEATIDATGWSLFPAAYMVGVSLIGLVAWSFLRETAGTSLRGSDVPDVRATPPIGPSPWTEPGNLLSTHSRE